MVDVIVRGGFLVDYGFVNELVVDGYALNTFGFLSLCDAIWFNCDDSITTTWNACSTPSGIYDSCLE